MKLDEVDLEHIEQTVRSAGYAAIARRWAAMAEGKLRELRRPLGVEDTARVRGFLEGLEACQRAPGELAAEIRRAARPARRRLQR